MEQAIIDLIGSFGYIGIIIIMIIEVVIPFIPSELVLPFGGFAAANGTLWLPGVIAAGTVGATIGSTIVYALAHAIPDPTIYRFVDKHGKWFGLSSKDVKRADAWFDRNAILAVFVCRMIPGLRTVISIPAGLSKMPFLPFILATFIGSGLWTTLLVSLGFTLGDNYEAIAGYISIVSYLVVAAVAAATVAFIWYRRHAIKGAFKRG